MNILVTGGAGFIGSATAQRLTKQGHQVVVIDNFNDYYDPTLKRAREKEFLAECEVVEGDICDEELLDKLFTKHQFDAVCHLAAQAGVRYSVEKPQSYVVSNVQGTTAILEAMKNHEVQRLVYASTSSAYGVATPSPFDESASADRPVSVYAATKRAGELLAHSYFHQYRIQATCLRFFTVYGPWSRPDMAMLTFAQKIENDEVIDIYNNGEQRRDFTYIDDIVSGFVLALEQPLGYEIVNLGNGKPVELMRFIQLLEQAFGKTASKNMQPAQQGDVTETYADTRKAKALLGFESKTDLETGIASFVTWYQSYFK